MSTINVARHILEANDKVAGELRSLFREKSILCLNLMSSPGAGKTALLERTLTDLKDEFKIAVIEGDIQTDNDARRVAATGASVMQINTEGACHLDGRMVLKAVKKLLLEGVDLLVVENVGNLVCPAEFSVGEDYKIVMLSVTEGDDKPEKYPLMFSESAVLLLNKIDLLPHVDFDLDKAARVAKNLNPEIEVFPISCRTGEGLENWYAWLRTAIAKKKSVTG